MFCLIVLFSLLISGFGDRLLGEVKQIAPKDIKIRVQHSLIPLHLINYLTYLFCSLMLINALVLGAKCLFILFINCHFFC